MLYYYFCAVFTLISATVSSGFSVAAYLKAKAQGTDTLTTAKYAMSRSFSLLLAAIGLLVFTAYPYLVALAFIMICIQLFDGIIGIKISTFKTIGPIMTAVGNAVMLVLFLING